MMHVHFYFLYKLIAILYIQVKYLKWVAFNFYCFQLANEYSVPLPANYTLIGVAKAKWGFWGHPKETGIILSISIN